MSVTLTDASLYMKNMNLQMKREFEEYSEENKNDSNNSSDANSEASDLENNPADDTNTAIDYSDNTLNLYPVADFIKKEFLPEFNFSNPFRGQNLSFKDPFLLPTQLYKSFLASLEKRRRNVADCYSLYPRNMLFGNSFGVDASDDEAGEGTDSPDEVIKVMLNPSRKVIEIL